jgi:hypothetical protein
VGRAAARAVLAQPADRAGLPLSRARIRELVAELDGDDSGAAEEAEHELGRYGRAVLEPLLEAAPAFGRFGKLCAIELFEEIGDARAGAVLVPMLRDSDDTVREWAARALGELGVREAVPELHSAYDAVRRRGTPLDWTEPERIRSALTALGARPEVVPERVAELSVSDRKIGRWWPAEHLPEVIEQLADARQLVLYFMYWERWRDGRIWVDTPSWELDWSLAWNALVETARSGALEAVRQAGTPAGTLATVSWMDEADR